MLLQRLHSRIARDSILSRAIAISTSRLLRSKAGQSFPAPVTMVQQTMQTFLLRSYPLHEPLTFRQMCPGSLPLEAQLCSVQEQQIPLMKVPGAEVGVV